MAGGYLVSYPSLSSHHANKKEGVRIMALVQVYEVFEVSYILSSSMLLLP